MSSAPMTPIHDEAFHAILEAKYARIINEISEMHSASIEEGVADLHCRIDKYLAKEIWREREEIKND